MTTPTEWEDNHAIPMLHQHVGHEMAVRGAPVLGDGYDPVAVRMVGAVSTTTDADQYGTYVTVVVSTTVNPVALVLPYDPMRQYAYLYSVDQDIVIATTKEQAESASNQVTSVPGPQGAYLPHGTWTPAIRHNDPVWVAATSATATRVTVMIERSPQDSHGHHPA
jgi:hypothetical protein